MIFSRFKAKERFKFSNQLLRKLAKKHREEKEKSNILAHFFTFLKLLKLLEI